VKVLLDTHALLWWFADDARLSATAREVIANADNEIWVSAASAWEIATKARIGKLAGVARLLSDFDALIAGEGFKHLAMTHRHAILAGGFSIAHRDPFDRMLVAQAMSESAVLLSSNAELSAFGVALIG
jgi:PIN domain nuclease of toxin-antitoxin system